MVVQSIKDLYFGIVRYASLPGAWWTRLRFRRRKDLKLHLGCGTHYIAGMRNIDGNFRRKKDHWLDLRNPLPFPTAGATLVYCSHTLEHFLPDTALSILREIRRVLAPEGVARIVTPCWEYAVIIAQGRATCVYPRHFDDPVGQAINHLFCDGQHKFAYSASVMTDFARRAGFTRIDILPMTEGEEYRTYDGIRLGNEMPGSLVVELRP